MSVEDVRNEIVEMHDTYIEGRDINTDAARNALYEGKMKAYIAVTSENRIIEQVIVRMDLLLKKFDEEFSHGT